MMIVIVTLNAFVIAGSIFDNLIAFDTVAEPDIMRRCRREINTRLAHVFNCLVILRFLDYRIGRRAETSFHLFVRKSFAFVFI